MEKDSTVVKVSSQHMLCTSFIVYLSSTTAFTLVLFVARPVKVRLSHRVRI